MITALITSLFLTLPAGAQSPQYGDIPKIRYTPNPFWISEGFKLGYLQNIEWEGIIRWTFEGEMALGYGTQAAQLEDRKCAEYQKAEAETITDPEKRDQALQAINGECFLFENPWHFSFLNTKLYNQYNHMAKMQRKATPVVIHYAIPLASPSGFIMGTNTKNFAYSIYPTDSNFPAPKHFEISLSSIPLASIGLDPAVGYIPQGRIVKASLDHILLKTYEVIIQENLLGNNFLTMSVNNSEMFDNIVRAMMTGLPVRIGYVEVFDWYYYLMKIRGYNTRYRIVSLDLLEAAPLNSPSSPVQ